MDQVQYGPGWSALLPTILHKGQDGKYPHDHAYYFQLMESTNADVPGVEDNLEYITRNS